MDEGLIVPVVKFADNKSLSEIAAEASTLIEKARTKKIQPSEFTGNTFTISNLGMMDIDEFTAIINPPDACILAVGKITPTPVVKEGEIVVRQIMKSPAAQEQLNKSSMETFDWDVPKFNQFFMEEIKRWAPMVSALKDEE